MNKILDESTSKEITITSGPTPWNVLRQKLANAKIREALTSAKIFVNTQQFTIIRSLGEGGYSTVYEVYDEGKTIRQA